MAEGEGTEFKPMTDADDAAPPADARFEPADPVKTTGVEFEPEADAAPEPAPAGDAPLPASTPTTGAKPDDAADGGSAGGDVSDVKAPAAKLSEQASDRVLALAGQGRDKATGALDQLVQLLNDAAAQVDDKVGAQYGRYARDAAGQVQGFADQVRAKSPDELMDDARALVRRSPGAAVGVAAALGFMVARLVTAGLDQRPGQPGTQAPGGA